ncbi:SecDF P1 head subdomain-containing protein [Ornithinimicrobium sp. INDO-MA30-4]|uniref:SecDF P1 head subdomain-containing protein n=1 Tax=Ornithinimicrobium sp. INDO-MA30-4 TaxID=2908651 RepID=UPI001F3E4BE8|nr:hypothetical protein [Ornithinimicrobium sp. INDO-MA30-4]UJH71159.1 hypothetical protein L0A91_04755 [Ornithinimicrobium sp. INDO-MA30-4]
MALNPRNRGPVRTLTALAAILIVLFGGIGAARLFADPAQLTPLLGLDLAGGRQIVLEPVVEGSAEVGEEQVDQAVDIIRRRIDGGGVGEAEVSRLGDTNISVAIPGTPTADQLDSLSRSSQLSFRSVLVSGLGTGTPEPTPVLPLPASENERLLEEMEQLTDEAASTSAPEEGVYPAEALSAQDDTSSTTDAPDVAPDVVSTENPSDLNQITPELQEEFIDLDCTTGDSGDAVAAAPSDQAIVACSDDGIEKYILGPVELTGGEVSDANAGLVQGQGGPTGQVQVQLTFNDEGTSTFSSITQRLMGFAPGEDQNRFAILLDGAVITAPATQK